MFVSGNGSGLWQPPSLLGPALRGIGGIGGIGGISCERISEVDEEEVSDAVLSSTRSSTSSTPRSSACADPCAESSTSSAPSLTSSAPLVDALADDATLADLSTVSTLSEDASVDDGDVYWSRDELDEDVFGEDEGVLYGEAPDDDIERVLEYLRGESDGTVHDTSSRALTSGDSGAETSSETPDRVVPTATWTEDGDGGTTDAKAVDDQDARLEAVALGCVLEDAVDQLCVLAHTSRAAKLAPDLANQSLNERLEAIDAKETERRNSVISGLRMAAASVGMEEDNARVDKIQRDRALVQEALRLQQLWLRLPLWSGVARPLLESPLCRLVREEEQRAAEEAVMLASSAKGAGRADVLRSKVQAEDQEARRQLRTMRGERAQLQEEARGLRARAALGAAITDRWERARLQQHRRHLQDQEQGLQRELCRVQSDYSLELRAHAELVEYLQQATQGLEQESEEWQARYGEVTAGWDAKLAELKARRQEHTRQLRAVRKELARRERFKRDFLAYKAARDHEIEERTRMNAAATRIQSWWRMTMVRKGLGPWKRMAKKKKKKKK